MRKHTHARVYIKNHDRRANTDYKEACENTRTHAHARTRTDTHTSLGSTAGAVPGFQDRGLTFTKRGRGSICYFVHDYFLIYSDFSP